MKEQSMTKPELIEEISVLKQRIQELEKSEAERKQVEEALQESERKYRFLAERMTDIIWILDLNFKTTYVSPSIERVLGFTPEEHIRHDLPEMVTPASYAKILERLTQEMEKESEGKADPDRVIVMEVEYLHKDGHTVWAENRVTAIRDEKGNLTGLHGVSRDITDRKRAEEALQQSEAKFRALAESSAAAVFLIQGTKYIYINPAFEKITGYMMKDLADMNFWDFIHPDYRDLVRNRGLSRLKGQSSPSSYEIKFITKNGQEKWVDFSATIIELNNRQTIMGSTFDITERKQAEESFRESQRRLSNIIEFLPDATLVINKDGAVIAWNRALEAMTGVRAEEMLGKGNYEYALPFYGERRPILIDLVLHPDPERDEEYTAIRRTGDIIFGEAYAPNLSPGNLHLSATASVLRNSSGEIIAAIECIRNNTERKRLESQLHQAQQMEAIGTLAGGIAHDFNNILGAIMGYTEMALTVPNMDERLRRYLNQVYRAGERAADLVKQILAFSRQSDQKPRPLRVSPIVKEVLKLLRATLPTTITIHRDIQSDIDTILADPTQLHQIMMNLCTNAAHAMRGKKGELRVSLVPVEIKPGDSLIILHGLTPDVYLKLTVSDSGGGIAPDIMERIFDPFFTTKPPGEGTGMGLAVVHGIVKSYHGAITVESEAGKGTDFHVYLPLLKEAGAKREIEAAAEITGGKERILFVDDEEMLVQIGKDMLTSLGYEVTERTSSLEALKLFQFRPDRFDLVITDMTMPNMTGIELAREIMRIRPGIPVILCTGFSEAITSEKAKEIGLKDFIMKPLIRNEIAAAIRCVLDQKEQG